ncbi:ammonia transport outward protein 2 [Diutina catenulata]
MSYSESDKEISSANSTTLPVSRLEYTGDNNRFLILGGKKYDRDELLQAFGGTFQVERYAPRPKHEIANPSPLGLGGFGITTLILGLYYAGAMGIKHEQVIIGMGTFYASSMLFLSGVWEMVAGNTFAATTFTSFGAFWWAFVAIQIKSFGIAEAYADEPEQLENALGFWLSGWAIFVFGLILCTLKSTWAFIYTFVTLDLTFILLAAGAFTGNASVHKAGGIVGCCCASGSIYLMYAGIANRGNTYSWFVPKAMPVPVAGNKSVSV